MKNLSGKEGIEKLRSLAKEIDFCMFCTNLGEAPFSTRPMSTRDVDDEGNIWFFSRADSNKNLELKQDDQVQLLYAKPGSSEFLSVYGHADVTRDRNKAAELWSFFAKTWFNEGVDDPELTIIRVRPAESYYWDTKSNKLVSLISIVAGAVTGKEMDSGIEGDINP
ncbi:MAG: ral stress protein [Chitinophagaceae bacterium]|nr:ral stress protein [Chitinophagaceae bacterium]